MGYAGMIFLGGVTGKNKWRDTMIDALTQAHSIPREWLFNPVVEKWTPEAQLNEERAKKAAGIHYFYIGDPGYEGSLPAFSMVEATMSLYDRSDTTIVVFDPRGIDGRRAKTIIQARKVLEERHPGALIYDHQADGIEALLRLLKDRGEDPDDE